MTDTTQIRHIYLDASRSRHVAVVVTFKGVLRTVACDDSRTQLGAAVRRAVKAWRKRLDALDPVRRAVTMLVEEHAERERCTRDVLDACKAVAAEDDVDGMAHLGLVDAQRLEDASAERFTALLQACELVLPDALVAWGRYRETGELS
jgi:hypothetical protein